MSNHEFHKFNFIIEMALETKIGKGNRVPAYMAS